MYIHLLFFICSKPTILHFNNKHKGKKIDQ